MKVILIFGFLATAVLCMPQNIGKEETTALPTTISVPISTLAPLNNQKEVQTDNKKDQNNQGDISNFQFGFLQTVRKEWKCANGQCQEHITKCKNGQCESVENKFKADNYQPEAPQLVPFPFPSFNFAEFFNFAFPKFDFDSFFNFDNFGLMDTVIDTKNENSYFSDAKIITSKCNGNECLIHKKDCTNGKCNEISERRSI